MDWTPLVSGVGGALVGGLISISSTYFAARGESSRYRMVMSRSDDAPVIAEALSLLQELDPARIKHLDQDPVVNQRKRDSIWDRSAAVRRKLMEIYVLHPSAEVQASAKDLSVKLDVAANRSLWLLSEAVKDRDDRELFNSAEASQKDAVTAADEMKTQVNAFATGSMRKSAKKK